jgi:hypothetical protein
MPRWNFGGRERAKVNGGGDLGPQAMVGTDVKHAAVCFDSNASGETLCMIHDSSRDTATVLIHFNASRLGGRRHVREEADPLLQRELP